MNSLYIEALPYCPDSTKVFELLRPQGQAVLLDSAQSPSALGRYDIISAAPVQLLTEGDEPGEGFIPRLRAALAKHCPPAANPQQLPFAGGAIGFFSYDLGRQLHKLPHTAANDRQQPLACAGIYQWAVISDHLLKRSQLVAHPDCSPTRVADIHQLLLAPADIVEPEPASSHFKLKHGFKPSIDRQQYGTAFARVQDYIQAGDCYQINLAQRFSSHYQGDPWQAYKLLRHTAAAPFSSYLELEGMQLMSLSPERFLELREQRVSTCPIKGTIGRGENLQQDRQLAQQLLASEKDRAENLMIVDLMRNDLGKHCRTGSVKVDKLFELQSFETVHHLVSTISAELPESVDALELLADCFPGGSITGAPKLRAMEIIDELEGFRRQSYCGSIGYISADGQMDTNIAIRTLSCDNGRIDCWAGGGIVADSDCDAEYQECLTKVGKLLQALEQM